MNKFIQQNESDLLEMIYKNMLLKPKKFRWGQVKGRSVIFCFFFCSDKYFIEIYIIKAFDFYVIFNQFKMFWSIN